MLWIEEKVSAFLYLFDIDVDIDAKNCLISVEVEEYIDIPSFCGHQCSMRFGSTI